MNNQELESEIKKIKARNARVELDKKWETAEKLGLDRNNSKFGSVDTTYQHYFGIDPEVINMKTPEISFSMDPPEWAKGNHE